MAKRVTLKDIAEKLSISQNTVSVALRGGPGVSENLRSLIFSTAQEMGYSSKHSFVRPSILICSTAENFSDTYFFSDLQRLLNEKIRAKGGKAVSVNLDLSYSKNEVNQIIKQNESCAIVLLGDASHQIVSLFASCGIPVLCSSFFCPIAQTDSVIEDNFSGIYQLLMHLYEHNYKKIGFIGNPNKYFSFFERLMYFQKLCEHFSMPFDPNICITDYPLDHPLEIKDMTTYLSALPYMPEAFLCADDRTAVLTIRALTALNYSVPKDVAVTGFDNSDLARLNIPSITTIDTQIEAQTDMIVSRIWSKIRTDNKESKYFERIISPISFIQGDSVDLEHMPVEV